MNNEQNINLQTFMASSVVSENYIPVSSSLLYNNGRKRPADFTKFYIQTVNENGQAFKYSINGFEIAGLVLFINPTTVSINASKIVNRTQTMTGWVEDHWGEELDTISFQGSSAAFIWDGVNTSVPTNIQAPLQQSASQITDDYDEYMNIQDLGTIAPVGTGTYTGLAVEQRRSTASYKEFRYLMQLMNANAATFDINGLVSNRLYIQISYDYASYRGYFESFDLTESADAPYRFTYNITYKSEKTMYSYMI